MHSSIDSCNSLLNEEIFIGAFKNALSPQTCKEKGGDGPGSPECAISGETYAQESTRDEVSF